MEDTAVSNGFVTLAEGTIASDYALKNLNKSLGEAQVEFTPASKGEENKWGGYKYTSLENIVRAVRPSLAKHHLTVSQFPIVDLELKTVSIVSRLVHWDSGEWMQNTLLLPGELALGKDGAPKFNQQTIGGSSTYAQKYAYKTILGIPDSEEMIDSTEEKGDLPARSKKRAEVVADAQKRAEAMQQRTPEEGPFQLTGDILKCVIRGVNKKKTVGENGKEGKEYIAVVWNGRLQGFNYATTFDSALFDPLMGAVNQECELKLKAWKAGDKFINIVGLESISKEPVSEETTTAA